MAYKGAGFGSNSTMPVPNRGPLNGPWTAPAPRRSAAGQAPGGFSRMLAGIAKIDSSQHTLSANSPAPNNNSPVGGAQASQRSASSGLPDKMPAPDTRYHNLASNSPAPAKTAPAAPKPAAKPQSFDQTYTGKYIAQISRSK